MVPRTASNVPRVGFGSFPARLAQVSRSGARFHGRIRAPESWREVVVALCPGTFSPLPTHEWRDARKLTMRPPHLSSVSLSGTRRAEVKSHPCNRHTLDALLGLVVRRSVSSMKVFSAGYTPPRIPCLGARPRYCDSRLIPPRGCSCRRCAGRILAAAC